MGSASHLFRVGRVWGVHRGLAVALGLAAAAQLTAGRFVGWPALRDAIAVPAFVPPLAGLLLAQPLLDGLPHLTRLSMRSPLVHFAARFVAVHLCGSIVVLGLVGSGRSWSWSLSVTAFVSLGALLVAGLQSWYWIPMLATGYGWIQVSTSQGLLDLVAAWTRYVGAMVLLAAIVYSWVQARRSQP